MKLIEATAVLALIASPALGQTSQVNVPSAHNSGAGISGQPGNKNGPAAGPQGQASANQSDPARGQQDPSRIPGKPGSKSGPAVMPPSHSAERQ